MEARNLICLNCKHLLIYKGGCKAYPKGIPDRFVSGQKEHRKIEKDQVGTFVFENIQ